MYGFSRREEPTDSFLFFGEFGDSDVSVRKRKEFFLYE